MKLVNLTGFFSHADKEKNKQYPFLSVRSKESENSVYERYENKSTPAHVHIL